MKKISVLFAVLFLSIGGTFAAAEVVTYEQASFSNATASSVSGATYDGVCNNKVTKNSGNISTINMWFNSESKHKKGIATGETEEISQTCWVGSYDTAHWAKHADDNGTGMSGTIELV